LLLQDNPVVPALCFPVVSHRFIVPINDTDGYDERSGSNLAPLVLVNAIIIIGENASTSAISSSATIDEDDDRKKIDVVNFDISEGLAWYAVKK
jgi:hypothetical protein